MSKLVSLSKLSSEWHADGRFVEPRQALARNALEIMVALLSGMAEAVRVRSHSRSQIRCPLQRVAVVRDPSRLLVFVFVVRVGVLKIGVTLNVVMLLVIHDFRVSYIWVEKRDFSIIGLEEDRVFQVRSHIHGSLVVNHGVVAGGPRSVRASIRFASERHSVMLLVLLLFGRLLFLLGGGGFQGCLVEVLFFTVGHKLVKLVLIER